MKQNRGSLGSTIKLLGKSILINHSDDEEIHYNKTTQEPEPEDPVQIKTRAIVRNPTTEEIKNSGGNVTQQSKVFVIRNIDSIDPESYSGDTVELNNRKYLVDVLDYDDMKVNLSATDITKP